MDKVNVSVIVPVYNAGSYLRQALDSLIEQTLPDIEIICIDDKSTDSSLAILREYENKYPSVRVISLQQNMGEAVARNQGMVVAEGDYIGFLDADDYVDRDFFEKLYTQAQATGADIVKGKVKTIDYEGKVSPCGPDFGKIQKNKFYFSYAFWSAIYKRSFLQQNAICFPPGIILGPDYVFLTRAVLRAKHIALVSGDSYYFYLRNEFSMDSRVLNQNKITSAIAAFNMVIDLLNDVSLDRESYIIVFSELLDRVVDIFYRNNTIKSRVQVTDAALAIYNKNKYPLEYRKENFPYEKYLRDQDQTGLFLYLLNAQKFTIEYRFCNLAPLLQVRNTKEKRSWLLFNVVPLMVRRSKQSKIIYRLFGFLPLLTRVDK